jgi:ketosteroid isomerase-like protein
MALAPTAGCSSTPDPATPTSSTSAVAPADVGTSAPDLTDPVATATDLVTTWLETLRAGESVEDLMAPNFIIQRADGSSANRDEYLAKPAQVSEFTLGKDLSALQSGNTLTVRWSIRVTEAIDGVQYTDVEAPRLTVFEWTGDAWKIVGYANFNPPKPDES